MTLRRLVPLALALTTGSLVATLPSPAGAVSTPAPQYIVQFSATVLPPASAATGFHSTSCAIGPAIDPIVVRCQEDGTVRFTDTGGSGTATVTSVLSTIHWKFTLHRAAAVSTSYRMVGKGTETAGTSPVVRAVKVTGTVSVLPTPDPTFQGTEDIYPLPSTAS